MSEWISKAANVFKRDVSETPQPFEVCCECGQKHSGIRRSRQQHLVCKTCGSSLFVLPHDTYPPPHVPKSSGKKRKRKPTASKPVDDTLDLAPSPVIGLEDEEDSEVKTKSGRHARRLNDGDPGQEVATSEVDDRPNIIVRLIQSFISMVRGFVEVFWEFWTPYRKLALLIACILSLTAYYSIHQSRLRSAVNVVKEELDNGLADLNQSRWVEARQHFEIASNAVDLLDRDDLEANSIRQYHRETTALTRLTSISLIELAEIAEKFYIEHGAEEWQQEFERKYQADWYIIEGYLRPTTDADSVAAGYHLELVFPIAVGNRQRPVDVQIAFPLAKNLPRISSEAVYDSGAGSLAVFAVQVQQCSLGTNGNWVIRMNPATSFFWANLATYEATHLNIGSTTPVEEQNQLFQQQGLWMGVSQ